MSGASLIRRRCAVEPSWFRSTPRPALRLPCWSRSMARVRYPALAKQMARLRATVVLPQPPLALASVKILAMDPGLLVVELDAAEHVAHAAQPGWVLSPRGPVRLSR